MKRPSGFRTDVGLSYARIEHIAGRVRKWLGIDGAYPVPGLKVFEGLYRYEVVVGDRRYKLDCGVAELPSGCEARTRYDRGADRIVVELTPDTYSDLELADGVRARNTLFHEIGHVTLHPALLVRMSEIPHAKAALMRESQEPYPFYYDTEWQANALAAAVLMPARELAKIDDSGSALDTRTIRKRFRVSELAAGIRLQNFEKRRCDLLGG
ncbi:MAG: ImmA/IrrE family metallo-endopeptidase [Deltaproteobacteria bacterium]|nr:ImmA/IrrE family metallo-endopeptidase [Deltaproteobacteria bacterium]